MNADAKRALEVRRLRAEGWTHGKIARFLKMSSNQVGKICRGEAWVKLTGGEAVLTDGEAELRMLTNPPPPPVDDAEQQAAIERLLKVQSEVNAQREKPDALTEYLQREKPRDGVVAPPPVKVRYPDSTSQVAQPDLGNNEAKEQASINAEQLLETLKDENQSRSS